MAHRMAVLRRALASPRLRRVESAFVGFGTAEYGVWVVVLVYAFRRSGTTGAGVIAAVQLIPSVAVAPLAARLIETRGAAPTLFMSYAAQALAIGLTAGLMLGGAPVLVVYAGAVALTSAVTLTHPAQAALLPALVETPAQLTAANVVSGWVDNLTLLVGPAIASLLLATTAPGWALIAFATIVAGAAVVVAPLRALGGGDPENTEGEPVASFLSAIRAAPGVIPALAMLTAEYAVLGALDVLEVVLAALVLGLGAAGAGYLGAAFGAGGLVGAGIALSLVGRHRLAVPLLLGGIAWGASFIAIGLWPAVGAAVCLLAIGGAGRTVLDVGGRTTLHRTVPPRLHGRVFSALEALELLGLAIGALSVPLSVAIFGPRATVVVVGGLLIVVPMLTTPILRGIERATPALDEELGILRQHTLFEMLSAPVLEDLARALRRIEAPAGETIIYEDDTGDDYFVVVTGELSVSINDARVRTLAPGDGFGEIALLRDGRRTATVTASSDVTLYGLQRASFLEAVTGSRRASQTAHELVADRLAS
jgi:Cyclic nucleotide-binding domain